LLITWEIIQRRNHINDTCLKTAMHI